MNEKAFKAFQRMKACEEHCDSILLFLGQDGIECYNEDADKVSLHTTTPGVEMIENNDVIIRMLKIPLEQKKQILLKLVAFGKRIGIFPIDELMDC